MDNETSNIATVTLSLWQVALITFDGGSTSNSLTSFTPITHSLSLQHTFPVNFLFSIFLSKLQSIFDSRQKALSSTHVFGSKSLPRSQQPSYTHWRRIRDIRSMDCRRLACTMLLCLIDSTTLKLRMCGSRKRSLRVRCG